jgi:hypothetical protein
MSKNIIIPEITLEMAQLRDILAKEMPAGCKFKIPPLNRKCLRVAKSFCIATEVHLRKNKIVVTNPLPGFMGIYMVLFLPLGIYATFKMKESEAQRSAVHDIIFRATRTSGVA